MAVVVQERSASVARRQRALAAYLLQLRLFCTTEPTAIDAQLTLEIPTEAGGLRLEPWVLEQLHLAFAASELGTGTSALVAQSVALLIKCGTDRHRLKAAAGDEDRQLYAGEAELMLDVGLGMALSRELQRAVDEAVQQGGAREAKDLSRLHHIVRRAIADAQGVIAQAERQSAETLSDDLTDQPRQPITRPPDPWLQRLSEQAAADHERAVLQRIRHHTRRVVSAFPSRTEMLVLLLAICLAAWMAVVSLGRLVGDPLPGITIDDLPRSAPLLAVEALPPSLFATVDAEAWAGLDGEERRDVVAAVSNILLTQGYSGALLTTPDGRPVGRWLESRGVELIETTETAVDLPVPQGQAASGSRGAPELANP